MTRRVIQLIVGLAFYGVGAGLTLRAGLGVDPWTVLAEGIGLRTGIGVGWVTNLLGAAVLLAWIPLRQHPGVGTVANIAVVGTSMQATISLVSAPVQLWSQLVMLLVGVLVVAISSGLYIGAHFGPGPRDGLMTGLHARTGAPIWLCRLVVEGTVLVLGWTLGGTVGLGTVLFALCIGPLVHVTLPLFDLPQRGDAAILVSGRPALH
ncbi:hypothetical protein [Microbacterium sp. 10M-3C3]|jgi:uncharacterized membrane protein YczE|uniref:membrane protein YczE n=1 Tax=Microbacterium sp. 10M-3C3 TaxID=2483401 RepID=UPI00197BBEBA|nr:hypothetical protein [Microbacterium sp. 10M-3C3]